MFTQILTVGFAEYMLARVSLKSLALKWAPQTLEYLEGLHRIFCGSDDEDVMVDVTSFLMAVLHLRLSSGSEGNLCRPGSVPSHPGTMHVVGMFSKFFVTWVFGFVACCVEVLCLH